MSNRYSFIGGKQGTWQVVEVRNVIGAALALVERVNVVNDVATCAMSGG